MKRYFTLAILALVAVVALATASPALAGTKITRKIAGNGGSAFLTVQGGAATATSQTVALEINWPGSTDWMEKPTLVRNETGDWMTVAWTRWYAKNYDTRYTAATWQLTPGAGTKTVTVQVVGWGSRNQSTNYTVSDGIQLL